MLETFHNDSTVETIENMQMPEVIQRNGVKSQTSPLKETSLQNPEPLRNSFENMKLGTKQYCAPITTRTNKTKPKNQITTSKLNFNGDGNFSLLTKMKSLFGKNL